MKQLSKFRLSDSKAMLASALQNVRNFDRRARFLMTLVALFAITTGAWADDVAGSDDFATLTPSDSYLSGQTTAGWTYDNSAVQGPTKSAIFGESTAVCINGKTSAVGTIVSPVIEGGIATLSLNYAYLFNESNGVSFNVALKKGDEIVASKDVVNASLAKETAATATLEFNVTEDVQIVITNNSPTQATNNKDRYSIWGISWTAPANQTAGVTISDDKSEATMDMPAYDATLEYTLKRDMTVDMVVTVQDEQQNSRFRVQKNGDVFQPVGLTTEQVMALFNVHDDIEEKDLTAATDYTVQIFAVNDDEEPVGDAMTFTTFTYAPGNYIVKAVAVEGSNYSGTTSQSNVFTLYQGYEIVVPAGEYVTYYKEEALYVEDENVQLYTITEVGETTATATELTVAAANTPLLVKNNAQEEKTILLIPTTEQTPDEVTVYSGFKGTLEATQIAASTDEQNNYAFNGLQFVWVKNAIDIAANKAWLEVPVTTSNARAINIVFGEATGLKAIDNGQSTIDNWYDLNGRKLNAMPTKRGVYILNGKKVVVK